MPYDQASFQAGFALGRVLWMPRESTEGAEPDLGWTADPEWLLFSSGEFAWNDYSVRTPVSKVNDGRCIAAVFVHCNDGQFGGNWCYCVLISTVLDYVLQSMPGGHPFVSQKEYLGLTWYVCSDGQNSRYGGGTSYDTNCQIIDFHGDTIKIVNDPEALNDAAFLRIMTEANVRRTGTT